MNYFVRRWGNSAAVRIPASTLAAAGLKPDDRVDVREENGRIVIEKVANGKPDIQALIDAITDGNRHEETDWGAPAGKEVW
jgi:antitoxin MazE